MGELEDAPCGCYTRGRWRRCIVHDSLESVDGRGRSLLQTSG